MDVTFSMRVGDTDDDVLDAAKKVGVARIADAKALEELFRSRLARAVVDVVRVVTFEVLTKERERVEDELTVAAREDLHGFQLGRVVIARVEPTPSDSPFR